MSDEFDEFVETMDRHACAICGSTRTNRIKKHWECLSCKSYGTGPLAPSRLQLETITVFKRLRDLAARESYDRQHVVRLGRMLG